MMTDEPEVDPEDVVYDISQRENQRTTWVIRILAALTIVFGVNSIVANTLIYRESKDRKQESSEDSTTNVNGLPTVSFRRLPEPNSVLTSIAFGSCASQRMPQPYWDTLVSFQPNITLLMGDNVYGDCKTEGCPELLEAYQEFARIPSLLGAAPELAIMATLDDHDYGMNDATGDNPHKDMAKEYFINFFGLNALDFPEDGVYHSKIFGTGNRILQIIFLDTRYSKTPFEGEDAPHPPSNSTDNRMLSESQWNWLEDQMQIPADLRLLVSSIQVVNDVTGNECWRLFPLERTRLYNIIRGNDSVIILSGDRHFGGFYETEDRIREVTSSSWTHTFPLGIPDGCDSPKECDEADPRRIGDLVHDNNFGLVEIDWETRQCTVSLRRAESTPGIVYFDHQQEKDGDAGSVISQQVYSF